MKRLVIVFVILAATAAAGNAQFFVEGSVGVGFSEETTSLDGVTKNASSNNFGGSSLGGYQLNENFALGVRANLYRSTNRYIVPDPNTGNDVVFERKSPGWGLSVFDRYRLLGAKKISFLVESAIFMGVNNFVEKRETTTIQNLKRTSIGIQAFPLISYDLSDRFSFIVSVDFLSLNLYAQTENNKDTGSKKRTHHFDFDAKSDLFDNLREVRIGVVYHFNKSGK